MQEAIDQMPAELSGGMRQRAALALGPPLLFLAEPGAGLGPPNPARLDTLILQLRDQLGTTAVMVTHDIDSAVSVADRELILDEVEQTMTALDTPHALPPTPLSRPTASCCGAWPARWLRVCEPAARPRLARPGRYSPPRPSLAWKAWAVSQATACRCAATSAGRPAVYFRPTGLVL